MKFFAACCVVAMPMMLFLGLMLLYVDGRIGVATMLVSAFAVGAVTVTALVFHGAVFALEETEEQA